MAAFGGKGAALYAFLGNDSLDTYDWLGLVDCAGMEAAIKQLENLCHQQLQSMSELSLQFANAETMLTVAKWTEVAKIAISGYFLAEEMEANESESVVGAFIDDDSGMYISTSVNSQLETELAINSGSESFLTEGSQALINMAVTKETGWNLMNLAESASEKEEEMAKSLSEQEYDALKNLQNMLKTEMDAYHKGCPCGKL